MTHRRFPIVLGFTWLAVVSAGCPDRAATDAGPDHAADATVDASRDDIADSGDPDRVARDASGGDALEFDVVDDRDASEVSIDSSDAGAEVAIEAGLDSDVAVHDDGSDVVGDSRDVGPEIVDGDGPDALPDIVDVVAMDAPRRYVVSMPVADCELLLRPTSIPIIGNDVVSDFLPLPFAFGFMGETITHVAASSNGNLQLFPSAVGLRTSVSGNLPIPDPRPPNRYLAPFWDDLENARGVSVTDAWYETIGTAPSRVFIVEWYAWRLVAMNDSSLGFQVLLFESSNVIEFRYCTISPSSHSLVTGGSATIGIENGSGTDGVLHSFNMPNSVRARLTLRFTPTD